MMGAWGHKNFENDDACDWVYDLEKSKDKQVIHEALNIVLNNHDYLESPDCCNALAAADVVLAGVSGEYTRVTDEVRNWLNRKMDCSENSQSLLIRTMCRNQLKHAKRLWHHRNLKDYGKRLRIMTIGN
jgi:Domain of unknown function (DUF4259)